MRIWIVRHGETELNKEKRMQGLTDELLDDEGLNQAYKVRKKIENISFDAVYSSHLQRAIMTASIVGNVEPDDILVDDRVIEMDFGKYEGKKYSKIGLPMAMYYLFPNTFDAPESVETIESIYERTDSFFSELREENYKNVLIATHGTALKVIFSYLAGSNDKVMRMPLPENCEIRVFEKTDEGYSYLEKITPEEETEKEKNEKDL